VDVLKDMDEVMEASMFGRLVHVVVKDRDVAREEIPRVLEENGVALEGLVEVAPSLEDVFVALVRKEGGAVEG
jgi:hypothetical protein